MFPRRCRACREGKSPLTSVRPPPVVGSALRRHKPACLPIQFESWLGSFCFPFVPPNILHNYTASHVSNLCFRCRPSFKIAIGEGIQALAPAAVRMFNYPDVGRLFFHFSSHNFPLCPQAEESLVFLRSSRVIVPTSTPDKTLALVLFTNGFPH
jgi:hypothetical protein